MQKLIPINKNNLHLSLCQTDNVTRSQSLHENVPYYFQAIKIMLFCRNYFLYDVPTFLVDHRNGNIVTDIDGENLILKS